jgi:hypothetical protein
MTSPGMYLGVIHVIAIILIAFFAWRYWRRHRKDGFTYATPAVPRMREAAAALFASLQHMVALGRSFECQAARLPQAANALPGYTGDASVVTGARQSAAVMVRALDVSEKRLSGAPPTYANYLAAYRGLTSTDVALLNAADAYTRAGHEVSRSLAQAPAGAPMGDLASLASTLLAMGRQLRQVVAAVHRLGAALDVE